MWCGIVSIFPEMFQAITEFGITSRALRQGQLQLAFSNPRQFVAGGFKGVDDRPYGGGPGMVMQVDPLRQAVQELRLQAPQATVIYLSPQGRRVTHTLLMEYAQCPEMIFVAGRYEGVDERFVELEVDAEWSVGDFVLTGGELAVMSVIDAMVRLIPGVLGHEDSAQEDSFVEGLLDCPHYTRPVEIEGLEVPEVLLSGHHAEIAKWRLKQRLGRTWMRRPDLLLGRDLTRSEQTLLNEFMQESLAD